MLHTDMKVRGLLRIAILISALTWAVILLSVPIALGSVAASPRVDRHPVPWQGPPHRPHARRTASTSASIVGGVNAEPGAFPWLAFLVDFKGKEAHGCTGTVVASNLILTAGHCAEDSETGEVREASGYRVFTGNVDWASAESEVSEVSRVIPFPHGTNVTVESWPDVALLELSSPIHAPAVKFASNDIWGPGTEVLIAGWGKTYYRQAVPSEQLRWASTVVQSRQWCEANAPGFDPLGQICTIDAPSYASGTCLGDSGGPLLALQPGTNVYIEIGITSSGPEECSTSRPDLFTRSDMIAPWLDARIREMPPPPSVETLPTMTHSQATTYVRQSLRRAFGGKFTHRYGYRTLCRPIAATKQKCGVSWSHGPNYYHGWITVYYLLDHGELLWNDRYAIHWVTDQCHFFTHHRGRCIVHTKVR